MNTSNGSVRMGSEAPSGRETRLHMWAFVCSLLFVLPIVPFVGVILAVVYLVTRQQGQGVSGLAIAAIPVGVFNAFILQGVLAAIAIPAYTKYMERSRAVSGKSTEQTGGSADVAVSFQLPEHWSTIDELHDDATFQAGNRLREEYLIVLTDNKIDYAGTLAEHAELTSNSIINESQNSSRSDPKKLTINGYSAIQYEIACTVDNINLNYLHTTLEGQRGFHQVLAWTVRSKKAKGFVTFAEVLGTFQELPAADGPIEEAPIEEAPSENGAGAITEPDAR